MSEIKVGGTFFCEKCRESYHSSDPHICEAQGSESGESSGSPRPAQYANPERIWVKIFSYRDAIVTQSPTLGAVKYVRGDIAQETEGLCAVHKRLEKLNKLEVPVSKLGCVACSLNEREELLLILEPCAPPDQSKDSTTVLRELVDFWQTHHSERPEGVGAQTAKDFREWFASNHPFDWWASERDGEPLPQRDRLLVSDLCRRAFESGVTAERERIREAVKVVAFYTGWTKTKDVLAIIDAEEGG